MGLFQSCKVLRSTSLKVQICLQCYFTRIVFNRLAPSISLPRYFLLSDVANSIVVYLQVMLSGAGGGAGADGELLTVTIARDEQGYGMKVSGGFTAKVL